MSLYNISIPAPQSWPNCGKAVFDYVNGFVSLLRGGLADNLVGVYLHGSLAMGSYFPPKSDMDFIIVVVDKIGAYTAESLNISIARYAEARPTAGSIECSVITLDTAKNAPSPTPYELHYSDSWHRRILDRAVAYGAEQYDPDLPAHLMCVKKRGVCLYGMDISATFGDVGWRRFVEAVLYDFDEIVDGDNIIESPYYSILNICRVMQIFGENNEKYLSKYEGAMWGAAHMPHEYKPLILKALEVYASNNDIGAADMKTGGVEWDRPALLVFRDYAKNRVLTAMGKWI